MRMSEITNIAKLYFFRNIFSKKTSKLKLKIII